MFFLFLMCVCVCSFLVFGLKSVGCLVCVSCLLGFGLLSEVVGVLFDFGCFHFWCCFCWCVVLIWRFVCWFECVS